MNDVVIHQQFAKMSYLLLKYTLTFFKIKIYIKSFILERLLKINKNNNNMYVENYDVKYI